MVRYIGPPPPRPHPSPGQKNPGTAFFIVTLISNFQLIKSNLTLNQSLIITDQQLEVLTKRFIFSSVCETKPGQIHAAYNYMLRY